MSTAGTILNFALGVVATVYPPAAPFIAIAQRLEPYAETAIPIIKAAISEGPAAFAAANLAAPDLFGHLTSLASELKSLTGGTGPVTDHELATLSAHVVGIDPPGWTHEETQRWWDRAQGDH